MKVLFLQDNGLNESPALTELSGLLLARGHRTSLLLERETPDVFAAAAAENPDVVLVPASVLAEPWVASICRRLKDRHPALPVVVAGSLPTLSATALERIAADFAVAGEAERPVLALLDALEGRASLDAVPGLTRRDGAGLKRSPPAPPVEDLDTLPPPDRGLYFDRYPFMAAFPWKKMLGGRGCFYDCVFCYQPTLQALGPKPGAIRRKSPARLVAEARDLRARWPATRHVHFSDDLFVSDLPWIRAFAAAWGEGAGLPYSLNTTADFITPETARLLADSGCRSVSIGVESADEDHRRRSLRKNVRNATIVTAAALIRAHGMTLTTFNMLASPDDTFDNALETLRFNVALKTDYARVTLAAPLPGTPMAAAMGRDPGALAPGPRAAAASAADLRRYANLYHLFDLGVTAPALLPLIERLVDFPWPAALAPAGLIRLWKEKRQFGLGWAEGLAYFRHVGLPDRRTANFVSLLS